MVTAFKSHFFGGESNDDSDEEDDFIDHITLDPEYFETVHRSNNELSESVELDSEPIPEHDAITEITDFKYQEPNHDSVFTTAYKCTSYFIHTLQLVKVFELTCSFKSSPQTAYSIVKEVNKSCEAMEILIKKARKN